MPKTRPSQGASKTSSPFLRGTARLSPRSSMRRSDIVSPRVLAGNHALEVLDWPADSGYPDHGVACDQCRQLLLRQSLRAGGALREHHVAHLRAAVVDVYRYPFIELQPELAQDRARLDDRPGAIGK